MSQYDFGNLSSPLSGTTFFNTHLEPWRDALHTLHSGTSRPSYAVAGLIWRDTTSTPWSIKMYDGTDDITIGTINATTNVFVPTCATISNTGTLTLPTSTDTLVGRATTDTLTNKTLTDPTINAGGGVIVLPNGTSPAQTAEGSIFWDSDDNLLTVGTSSGRKVMCDTDSTQSLTNKTYNGLTVSTTTGTITITNGKTLSVSNTLTFTGTDGSSAAFGAGGTVAYIGTKQSYTKQQNFGSAALTSSGASIAWNLDDAQFANHTFTENTTLANPTNMVNGGTYQLVFTQHASAPKTLAWGSAYKWAGGSAPTISSTNSAKDILTCVSDGTNMYCNLQKAFA